MTEKLPLLASIATPADFLHWMHASTVRGMANRLMKRLCADSAKAAPHRSDALWKMGPSGPRQPDAQQVLTSWPALAKPRSPYSSFSLPL